MALISLYTIRLLLQGLGVTDYGVLNATLSMAMLFSFMSSSIQTIAQRYLTFAIASGDRERVKNYYSASAFIAIVSVAVMVCGLETIGLWFVTEQMAIDPDRHSAVTKLYQFLIFFVAIGMINGFPVSVILAHEDMQAFALFSILGAALRLTAAFSLTFISIDSLVLYGFFLLSIEILMMALQWFFCLSRYEECSIWKFGFNYTTLRGMLDFARWTYFGQFAAVCSNHAVTLLINQAFTPATVAARALSWTIQAQVNTFSYNFTSALSPPITKSYASGNFDRTFSLIFTGSKIAFFLSAIVTLPLIALIPIIFQTWLEKFPDEAILFTRLAIAESLFLSISFPLITAIRAGGDIRLYELLIGGIQMFVLLVSGLLVLNGFPAYSVLVTATFAAIVMFLTRLFLAHRLIGFSLMVYVKNVALPIALTIIPAATIIMAYTTLTPEVAQFRTPLTSLVSLFAILSCTPICIYILGLSPQEKTSFHAMINKIVPFRQMKG